MKVKILIVVLLLGWFFYPDAEVEHEPRVLVGEAPVQGDVGKSKFLYADHINKKYTVEAVAAYDIKARVLSKKDYSYGDEADLSPTDLALGWLEMSNSTVIDGLSYIKQGGRAYKYNWDEFPPVPHERIIQTSANTHIIPANDQVADMLEEVVKGDIVHMTGYLVDVYGPMGWSWTTSRVRTDKGNGACEILWVEKIIVMND